MEKLLKEVKYFLSLSVQVPESAAKIYERGTTFRTQIGNLDLIVGIYNKIQMTILPVEKPLVLSKLEEVEKTLEEGLFNLNWNSADIDEYISKVLLLVKDVDSVLTTIKDNV